MNENTINNDVTMDGRASILASRYCIIKQLGAGGMGSVWLAEDTQLDDKLFAIKMLPSILVANKRAYAQLKSEALVAMKLTHPNIVTLRAFEENNGNPFLVMDYIDGETLDDWLEDKSQNSGRASVLASRSQGAEISEDEIVRLLKPIAEALDYAHTEGVVHRDIKPANVMIRKDGRPFIMDFGIAREIQETMTRVTGRMSSGTLMYMSPEQLNGDIPKREQDIYSFAAMTYECLKGEPPFCRGNIEYQIMNKDPESLPNDIAIASSVMAALAKKPEDRPKTCADVLKVNSNTLQSSSKNREVWPGRSPLREAKSLEACERPREPQVESAVFGAPRGKSFAKIAAISLLALGLVGGVWYWQEEKAKEEARIAPENQEEQYTQLAIEAFKSDRWEEGFSLSKKANHNNKEIQFYLGICYAQGEGVEQDDYEAVKWFRKAAEQGYADAQCDLGFMYEKGRGVPKDESEAVKWYRKAAEQGHERARKASEEAERRAAEAKRIAEEERAKAEAEERARKASEEIAKNTRLAIEAFEAKRWEEGYRLSKNTDLKDKMIQFYLGRCYANGQGVAKDESEAVKWYREAAEQGFARAQHNLGVFYAIGHGVTQDYSEAVKWIRKAAEQGDPEAQRNLGVFYAKGYGVTQDYLEAAKWYRKAAEQGYEEAKKALERLGY